MQFKEDDAVLCVRPGMSFQRRKFPKGLQGAMVSFKRVSCHSSSLVGHGPCTNSTNAVAYFSKARSKDDCFAEMLIWR